MSKETLVEPREWKLRNDLLDPLATSDFPTLLESLAEETGLSPITLRVCLARGLKSSQEIQDFLSPRLSALTDPMKIKNMELAIDRLVVARERKELVQVFGDYDVDGTTGAALFSWVLREFGFRFEATQPHRFKDGYGLNVGAVEEAAEKGASVLLTVDCGITSFDAAAKAKDLGIDLIVVDHHQVDPARGIPPAHSVINPQQEDCPSGLKQLCGCGLAFYVSMALRSRGRDLGWWPAGKEPNLKQHLDLVVLATAADMVPLTGDNHILVRHGLEVLRYTKKPGMKALLQVSGIGTQKVSPGNLGFVLGPRINASGRMGSADLALELLTTEDSQRAHSLAQELESTNQERATLQNRIWDQVRARVEEGLKEGKYQHGIVVADQEWHEGVVGIVASRVTETFHKPAVVIAIRDGIGKGSVRSFANKDVLEALHQCKEHLLGYGGHKHAAGLSLSSENVEKFVEGFDDALSRIAEDAASRPLLVEGLCSIEELDLKTLRELEALGPFGPGNPEPVFICRASVSEKRILKGRHLKMSLSSSANSIEAIWFHGAERIAYPDDLLQAPASEWAGVPEINRFRGKVTASFRIKDWRRIVPISDEEQ